MCFAYILCVCVVDFRQPYVHLGARNSRAYICYQTSQRATQLFQAQELKIIRLRGFGSRYIVFLCLEILIYL